MEETKVQGKNHSERAPQEVHDLIERKFPQYLNWLKDLVAFPGISAQGFQSKALSDTADWLEAQCKAVGFSSVERISLPGSAPYILASRECGNRQAPTILVYAHYDVQPTGQEDLWHSPPFKATERQQRLYGRGTADDKVGIIATFAALECFSALPVNLKVLLDGEEECGSPHMDEFLAKYRGRLQSDYLLVPDLVNPSPQDPGIFFSLRGLIEFHLKLSALSKPLHSGLGGGVVPDPVAALATLYARALGPKGEVRIPGIRMSGGKIPLVMKRALKDLDDPQRVLRQRLPLPKEIRLLHSSARKFHEALWFKPALSLLQVQVAEPGNYANRIEAEVSAVFSMRVSPAQDTRKVVRALQNYFTKKAPYSCQSTFELRQEVQGFFTDPQQKYFQKALNAVGHAYGRKARALGTGLTIPFVRVMQKHLEKEGQPLRTILLGVEDTESNAHAENESVSIAMFHSTIRAIANLCQAFSKS